MSSDTLKQQAEAYLDDWERHFAASLAATLGAAAAGLAPGPGDDDARRGAGGGAVGGERDPAGPDDRRDDSPAGA